MEIYSLGGGEIVYEVLKGVSLCLNGGKGIMQAMFTIGGLCGVFMAYFMILYGNAIELLKKWGLPSIFAVNMLFVPYTTVWVIDTISNYHYKIDKVPYGLAVFASNVSKIGKVLTETIEQNFSLPDDLKYQNSGLLFGSDILERSKEFKITNAAFKENIKNFVSQCVKYDIMLNQKYSFTELREATDIWSLITQAPSKNRGIMWLSLTGSKQREFTTCETAVAKFNAAWRNELDNVAQLTGTSIFGRRFISEHNSNKNRLTMDAATKQAIKREFLANLQSTASYLGDLTQSSEEILRQSILINAIKDSASENSKALGNLASYAEHKAWTQQNMNFDVIGRLAARLLPIMKAVIEALAYACFIFVIPLCMIPNGYRFFINWLSILAWLQIWAPMYAILNFVMNIAARAATISTIGGGLTIGNYVGVSEANADIKTLAGYLTMSIPFICIAIVRGLGTFVHLAGQMTGASSQAATSSVGEAVSGNFSYGNINLNNRSQDNISQLQHSYASSLSFGHSLNTGTMQIHNDFMRDRTIANALSETGSYNQQQTINATEDLRKSYAETEQRARNVSASLSQMQSVSSNQLARASEILSTSNSEDISEKYNVTNEQAKQIMQDARAIISSRASNETNKGTKASTSAGFGLNAKIFNIGASGEGYIGKSATESDAKEVSSSEQISDSERRMESFLEGVSKTNRNDEITQIARDHQVTKAKVAQYQKQYNELESQAEMLQASYNESLSRGVSEQTNIGEAIRTKLEQSHGLSTLEAKEVMESSNPDDKKLVRQVSNEIVKSSKEKRLKESLGVSDMTLSGGAADARWQSQVEHLSSTASSSINEVERATSEDYQQSFDEFRKKWNAEPSSFLEKHPGLSLDQKQSMSSSGLRAKKNVIEKKE